MTSQPPVSFPPRRSTRLTPACCLGHGEGVLVSHDRGPIRFALWVGPGRDPQVAYLDARLLAIATTEAGEAGLLLHVRGVSHNALGGERHGDLGPAVLHRMAHAALDRDSDPVLQLPEACAAPRGADGLCATAMDAPRPGTPYDEVGAFAIGDGFAIAWVMRDAVGHGRVVRRAVYADERFLLETGSGADGRPRAWPARGLGAVDLAPMAPSAAELAVIEDRIADVTGDAS